MTNEDEDQGTRLKQVGIYMTIPFVLAVPPLVGWLIGNWLDKWLGSAPFLMFFLIILGIVAGIREFYRIIKKYGNEP